MILSSVRLTPTPMAILAAVRAMVVFGGPVALVSGANGSRHTTIGAALTAAGAGDTIEVSFGYRAGPETACG